MIGTEIPISSAKGEVKRPNNAPRRKKLLQEAGWRPLGPYFAAAGLAAGGSGVSI